MIQFLEEVTTSEVIDSTLTSSDRLADAAMNPGIGALYAVVSIIMVFVILLIIIGVTNLIFKLTGLWSMKKELEDAKKAKNAPKVEQNQNAQPKGPVVIADDDMMAAVLVATIDYQNEIKKDVRLVSVKEVR